ncbi:MAG: phosphatase PAP2 family protein [Candidatus Kariarchaeaceae archaeon]
MLLELLNEINKNRFKEYLRGFTQQLGASFLSTFRGPLIILQLIAICISYVLIFSGADWSYFLFFKHNMFFQYILFPAVPLGGMLPLMIPPIIYLYGKKENKPELEPLAFALTQAAVVGTILISIYKAITGRLEPSIFEEATKDYSHDFAFGVLQRGVFHGWPSTHATVAWAFAIVFYYYRPELQYSEDTSYRPPTFFNYRKFGFVYAAYIGIAVSTNIHWLSDAVAGMFMGTAVGFAVVKSFESKWSKKEINNVKNSEVYWMLFIVFLITVFSVIRIEDF